MATFRRRRNLPGRFAARDHSGGFSFGRPLVLLQSDDWGRVGVRDHQGWEELHANGVNLGESPYDFYSLETADDVLALRDVLARHRDSTGRSACVVMNFLLANLDFPRMAECGSKEILLKLLTEGLPGRWQRPGLLEAYRTGIADGIFYPALHGLTHFCCQAVARELGDGGTRGDLLRTLWKAETPYIYWRMPWIGYEYYDPQKSQFLSGEKQAQLIREATACFREFLGVAPVSACAPGYRANRDTHHAWAACGVKVAQNGSGTPALPHMDSCGMLNLYRTIDFEPAHRPLPVDHYLQLAANAFAAGAPLIISSHSINFHSSLKDFRCSTLKALDQLLTALEANYPDLLYVHDGDLYEMVTRGRLAGPDRTVSIDVRKNENAEVSAAFGGMN